MGSLRAWSTAPDGQIATRKNAGPTQWESAVPLTEVQRVSRRRFLINLSGTTASITVVGAAVAAVLRTSGPEGVVEAGPEVELRIEHYRIDINLRPMRIDGETWRLPIIGMV